ncbi:MAG: hypothetical protein ACR5K5_05960, partial [Wolbachia sp.]
RTDNFIILNMETKGAKPFPKSPIYCFLNHSAERIRKKGKRNPVVISVHFLILQIGVLYCLKRLISAFQLI